MTFQNPTLSPYAASVMRWGNEKPWRREDGTRINLTQKERVTPADISTDGSGGLLAINIAVREECFGRPETYVRQCITMPAPFTTPTGVVKTGESRCRRCPAQAACRALVGERIKSDQAMTDAFMAWHDGTKGFTGCDRFIGAVPSRLWRQFKDAIAKRGEFVDANRAARLNRGLIEAARRREKDKIAHQNARDARRALGVPPTADFVAQVVAERDRRVVQASSAASVATAPRWLSKLPPKGVELTADAWAGSIILREHGRKVTAGTLADWLSENGRDQGMARESLRVRLLRDMTRADAMVRSGIWSPFDPD